MWGKTEPATRSSCGSSGAPARSGAVGRAVNFGERTNGATRAVDYAFEGFELGDALEAANGCLEDDLVVSEEEGVNEHVLPFTEDELLKPLEQWFFGHRS